MRPVTRSLFAAGRDQPVRYNPAAIVTPTISTCALDLSEGRAAFTLIADDASFRARHKSPDVSLQSEGRNREPYGARRRVMCPVCLSTLALVTASVTSTGGMTALVASRVRSKNTGIKERKMENPKPHLPTNTPSIVSPQEWEAARQQLLVKEKAVTRARDALAAERRRMPWTAVEKKYEFDSSRGKASLIDLFEGRRQLIVYRAFFEPGVFGWPEHACRGCSFVADQVAHVAHLNARDTTLAFASRAPQADIERLKERMGWKIPWYTITDSFDLDFGVDEWHGTNAFIRDEDTVFRTYFINNRGDEQMGSTWNYLDITALGRQEEWEDSPEGYPQTPPYKWWNWHDAYDNTSSSQWSKVVDRGLSLQGQKTDAS
jgi:predicted dithiol-disulfide oxidoreductase (DUF899 family)